MEDKRMSRMIPQYDTKLMTEIWSTAADFVDDYTHIGIPTTITNQSATTLFYLLYARYGNNPIANYDEEQFKYKIFSVVFQYGPTWEKKLALQATLRDLQLSDLIDDGAISELFSHQGENGVTESSFGMSERASEQEVAGSENGSVKSSEDSTNSMAQAVERTGSSTVARTGSAETEHTGTSEVERLGSQETNRTGTSIVANTGTSELAHTGTVGVEHDNDIENSGNDTTINNHAFNPGTSPAANAYDPLAYINEQNAQKVTKGTKSEQDESSITTYSNADTTTNNLQQQTTNNLTDASTSSSADTTTQNLKDKVTNDLTDTTTNNLTDSTESTGTASKEGVTTSEKGTTSHTEGSESVSNTGSKTVSGTDSMNDSRTRTMTVGKLEAYDRLLKLLDSDVTGEFISKFKLCFKQFVFPERTWIYVTEDGQEED